MKLKICFYSVALICFCNCFALSNDLLIEEFFINSPSSSIISGSKNLQQDVSYILTIEGTHSVWKTSEWLNNENNWQGVPENEPIFFDGEPSNNYVGADAAFSFSCPNSTFCIEEELPVPNPFFKFSLDNDSNWRGNIKYL